MMKSTLRNKKSFTDEACSQPSKNIHPTKESIPIYPRVRAAISIVTLGVSSLITTTIEKYKSKRLNGLSPQATHIKIIQENIHILDSELIPGEKPVYADIKKSVTTLVQKQISKLNKLNTRNFIYQAIHELRTIIHNEPKVMSSTRYADLLTSQLQEIILKKYFETNVNIMLQQQNIPSPDGSIDLLQAIHSDQFNLLKKIRDPSLLKINIDQLVEKACISAANLNIQASIINDCLIEGFKTLAKNLDVTSQQVLMISRRPIVAILEKLATTIERNIQNNNPTNVITTRNDYQEIQTCAVGYFTSLTKIGTMAKIKTEDPQKTISFLANAILVFDKMYQFDQIQLSNQYFSSPINIIINLYVLFLASTKEIFGHNKWENLSQQDQNLFLWMLTMLLKYENSTIKSLCNNAPLLKKIESELKKEGLQTTAILASKKPTDQYSSKFKEKIFLLSGGLNIVKYFTEEKILG